MSAMEGVEVAHGGTHFEEAYARSVTKELRHALEQLRSLWHNGGKGVNQDEVVMRCTVLLLELKRINREAALSGKAIGMDTQDTKMRIDGLNLHLQNLLYERDHLLKEIKKCRDFKSHDQEIELVSDADLAAMRPESAALEDPHARMLARLSLELEERKRLGQVLSELTMRKHDMSDELSARRKTLDGIGAHLDGILKASAPLAEFLGKGDALAPVAGHAPPGTFAAAALLPRPLYVVHAHASACGSSFGSPVSVTIVGDLAEARAFNENAANSESLWHKSEEDEDEADGAQAKRRRRQSQTSVVSERKKALVARHPLSVEVIVECVESVTVTLRFEYVPAMSVVTTHAFAHDPKGATDRAKTALTGDSLLVDLYPGDAGNVAPNAAAHVRMDAAGVRELDPATLKEMGRPYRWAQWVGGLDALPPAEMAATDAQRVDLLASSRHHIALLFTLLQQRVAARIALYGLAQKLLARSKDVPLTPSAARLFNLRPLSTLSDFKEISGDEFDAAAKKTVGGPAGHFAGVGGVRYFRVTFTRDAASVSAVVAVHPAYPIQPPVFRLWLSEPFAADTEAVRGIEKELNVHYRDVTVPGEEASLLANQLRMLQMCFDILVETEKTEDSAGRIFLRKHKGRDRARPFKYNHILSFFGQR